VGGEGEAHELGFVVIFENKSTRTNLRFLIITIFVPSGRLGRSSNAPLYSHPFYFRGCTLASARRESEASIGDGQAAAGRAPVHKALRS